MQNNFNNTNERAVILIKAAPQVGEKHGETVCCAGISLRNDYGWLRLYPVAFRSLEASQKFKRWDIVSFSSRKPKNDRRCESRHVNDQTLVIESSLPKAERSNFLSRFIVTSVNKEKEEGRSLALLKPEIINFNFTKKSQSKIDEEKQKFERLKLQPQLFNVKNLVPYKPCPYVFKYKYKTDDGERNGTCQDWEVEATFFNWRKLYGEECALRRMEDRFGYELPQNGILFAMGTHSLHPNTWLINGIIKWKPSSQTNLF